MIFNLTRPVFFFSKKTKEQSIPKIEIFNLKRNVISSIIFQSNKNKILRKHDWLLEAFKKIKNLIFY